MNHAVEKNPPEGVGRTLLVHEISNTTGYHSFSMVFPDFPKIQIPCTATLIKSKAIQRSANSAVGNGPLMRYIIACRDLSAH
jgi:hypothetical protein